MSANNKNEPIGIIGFGRFGQVLASLFENDYSVKVYDIAPTHTITPIEFVDLETVLSLAIIFVAVPIRVFSDTIKKIAPKISQPTTIIDVCSVKKYPVEIMQKHLPPSAGIIATHPLFGPDSIQETKKLKIVMHAVRDVHHRYEELKNYFIQKKITIIEMAPDEHDQLAATSQSIAHFICRCLEAINAQPTAIDTIGFEKLLQVMQQTCHDHFELFVDLIKFNPYSKNTIAQFVQAAESLQKKYQL